MTADGQIAGGHTCVSALICSERGGNPCLDSEVCPGLQKISGSYATAGGTCPIRAAPRLSGQASGNAFRRNPGGEAP